MTALILCFTLVSSPISMQPRPRIVGDKWTPIDGGKRMKQVVWYSDGTRKCFIVVIPPLK